MESSAEKLLVQNIQYDLSNYLVIENLSLSELPETLWSSLGIHPNSPEITYKRLYVDPHRMLTFTGVVIFTDPQSMRTAATSLNDREFFGKKVKCTPLIDRLSQINDLESNILGLSKELLICNEQKIQGLLSVTTKDPNAKEMAKTIFEKFGTVKTIKFYPQDNGDFYVLLFFNFRSEAYACEVAYNRVTKNSFEMKVKSEDPDFTISQLTEILDDLKKRKENSLFDANKQVPV